MTSIHAANTNMNNNINCNTSRSNSTNCSSVFEMNTKAVVNLKAGRIQDGMNDLRTTLVHARTLLLTYQETQQKQQQQQQQEEQEAPQEALPTQSAASGTITSNRASASIAGGHEVKMEDAEPQFPLLSLFSVPLFCTDHENCSCQMKKEQHAPGDTESGHCPLFDRAFVLASDDTTRDKDWMENVHCQNVTLGALLYNLALAHHLLAIQKGDTSQSDYQIAINLYHMALSLMNNASQEEDAMTEEEGEEQEESCQNSVLLLCGIFNNMANIHSRHFHVQETRNCLECLKEIVNSYVDGSHNTSEDISGGNIAVEEDHFFFYLNLYVTAPAHDFAIAPAA